MSSSLEPDRAERALLANQIAAFLDDWMERAATMPGSGTDLSAEEIASLMTPPSEEGRSLESILADVELAGKAGHIHLSGGHLSYIPNSGMYTAALAEFLAAGLNRYTGVASAAPGMTAIEHATVDWMTSLFDLGPSASGLLLSGGSMANFTAIVAARTAKLGDELGKGVLYVSGHTHHSVAKAARLAGFRNDQIRVVPVDRDLRMEPQALADMVASDRGAGLQPFLVVASAGTTDTGTVDPFGPIADEVSKHELWMHVDGAYGGFFQLTSRGLRTLAGIERADSIALDPHKGLSIPFGVGALLVRDEAHLIDTNRGRGAYLLSSDLHFGQRDIASLGPELSRPFRALQVWLPLHLHGIAPFREALDLALDLAHKAHERISAIRGVRALWAPDLSIVAFGFDDDDQGRAAMEAINRDRIVHVSSTLVDGRFVLRYAILNRRTTMEHIDHATDIIEKSLAG